MRGVICFMAISYLTQAQKDTVDSLVSNIHSTFASPITVFKINKKTSLDSNPNYNSIYRQGQTNVTTEEVSRTVNARVKYIKMGEELFEENDGSSKTSVQNRIILPVGSVKIKVSNDDHLFVKDSKRIEIANKRYIVFGNPRPVGFFDKQQYWEYFLAPTD